MAKSTNFFMKLVLITMLVLLNRVYSVPQVPCYFIFGDSLADNGNNDNLQTQAKVDYTPYGIDFPDGPTGRFTNGRTMFDIIAQNLGFDAGISPFRTAGGQNILTGVNYASGAAGIRPETGSHLGDVYSMDEQLKNHQKTISSLSKLLGGNNQTADYLKKCIYTVGLGNNDFINNYFQPTNYQSSRLYTPKQYAGVLADQYYQQLRTLFTSGARNVAVFAVGPVGCTPDAILRNGANASGCVDSMNAAAGIFNQQLKPLVDQLNKELSGAKFSFINPQLPLKAFVKLGVKVFDKACCPLSDVSQCNPRSVPCLNRQEHAFWDGFHPTEIVNVATAKQAYTAIAASYISPK